MAKDEEMLATPEEEKPERPGEFNEEKARKQVDETRTVLYLAVIRVAYEYRLQLGNRLSVLLGFT